MSIDKLIEEQPGGTREWLIRKGAYFYRPGKSGYTSVKSEAGRYSELDARREAEIEPWHMEAVHQDSVPDPAGDINVSEIASLKALLASTQAEILRLKAALAPFARRAFIYDGQEDDWFCSPSVQVKHLRAARSLSQDGEEGL